MVSVEGEKNTFNVLNRPFYNEHNSCFEFIIFRLQFMLFLCDFYVLCVCVFYVFVVCMANTHIVYVDHLREKRAVPNQFKIKTSNIRWMFEYLIATQYTVQRYGSSHCYPFLCFTNQLRSFFSLSLLHGR